MMKALAPFLIATLFVACSDNGGDAPSPIGCTSDETCGFGEVCAEGRCAPADDGMPDAGDPEPDPDPAVTVCTPCQTDAACGGADDRCSELTDGRFCTRDCETDNTPCPEGTQCQAIGDTLQCAPPSGQCTDCFDPDEDGFGSGPGCMGEDCAPGDGAISPDADEVCDGVDNNCAGGVDEGFDLQVDLNHCGGCGIQCSAPDGAEMACEAGACRIVACPPERGDCDEDPFNGCESALTLFFLDGDEDGFGRGDITERACEAPEGYVAAAGDCADDDGDRNPGVAEVCDGVDNNCVGGVDENTDAPPADRTDGVCALATKVCDLGGDFVEPDYNQVPDFETNERSCDGLDNDCDGVVDEDCPPCLVPLTFATVQAAADARCEEIFLQDDAPSDFTLNDPPEAVIIRPERGRLALGAVTITLNRGTARSVRLSDVSVQSLNVQSVDQLGEVLLERIEVVGVTGFTSPVTLSGFGLTVRASRFADNTTTGPSSVGGAMIVRLAPGFRMLGNVFENNRAEGGGEVGGAVFIESPESAGLIAGNLFDGNAADGAEAAGAIVFADGVTGVDLQNNTFVANTNGANLQASAIQCTDGLSGGQFMGNIFWFATGRHILGCDGAPIRYSNHENNVPPGVGNISVDPQLGDDRRPLNGSPCIDAGDPDPAFNDLNSTRNDMGFTGGPHAP